MEQLGHDLFVDCEPVGQDGSIGDVIPDRMAVRRHRRGLRLRFREGGAAAMADHEFLEMILARAMRRGDPKSVAVGLLRAFGDINHVLAANPARLARVRGMGARAVFEIKLAEAIGHRMARSRILNRPVLTSWDALLTYCATVLAHQDVEQVRVLFLDRRNILIADEAQAKGTVDHVPLYPREVIKRALELNASALIVVHNHPSGDPSPSTQDKRVTTQLAKAADVMGLVLHDHLIIGKAAHFSFRAEGLL